MPLEIERKFLVVSEEWRGQVSRSSRLKQGYLNREGECSIRVRSDGSRGWLNIKGVTVGAQRREFEYEIPVAEAEELLSDFTRGPLVEKTRCYIEAGEHVWEVDVFEGDNAGLIVAEIELRHVDERFDKPVWLGEEVTHDLRYYNTQLARHPYREWAQS
jgi:adenylate cyclase